MLNPLSRKHFSYIWFFFLLLSFNVCQTPILLNKLLISPSATSFVVVTPTYTPTQTKIPSPSQTQIPPTVTVLSPTETPASPPTEITPPWTKVIQEDFPTSSMILEPPYLTAPPYPQGTPNRKRPTYRWAPVANADYYVIWVWLLDKNDKIKEIALNEKHKAESICNSFECKIRPTAALIKDRKYLWQVQAFNDSNSSPVSSQFIFIASVPTETATITPSPTTKTN